MKQPISKLKQNFLQFKHSFNKHLDKYVLLQAVQYQLYRYRFFNRAFFLWGRGDFSLSNIILICSYNKTQLFYYTTYLLLLVSLSVISKYYLLSHLKFHNEANHTYDSVAKLVLVSISSSNDNFILLAKNSVL